MWEDRPLRQHPGLCVCEILTGRGGRPICVRYKSKAGVLRTEREVGEDGGHTEKLKSGLTGGGCRGGGVGCGLPCSPEVSKAEQQLEGEAENS